MRHGPVAAGRETATDSTATDGFGPFFGTA
jgi:hypothetical protein